MKTRTALLTVLILIFALAACAPLDPQSQVQPTPTQAADQGNAGMANPSATYCEEQGYTYEITTATDGSQAGVCKFPDGSQCDGWAYFRKECGPTSEKQNPENSPTQSEPGTTENKAIEAARATLADKLSLSADQVDIVSFELVDWPDACLGLAAPDEVCATVITPGFRVVMNAGDQFFTYHTDLTGSILRQETAGGKPTS